MKNVCLVLALAAICFFTKLNAQELTTFPGFWGTDYYQDDTKISKKQFNTLMSADPEANQLWRRAKRHETIGWVAVGAEVGFLVWQINRANNGDSHVLPLIGIVASAGVAIGFSFSAASLRKRSILKYNKNIDSANIHLGPTHNGLGLVLQF